MLLLAGCALVSPAQLTSQAPPSQPGISSSTPLPDPPLPDDPSQSQYPTASVVSDPAETLPLTITSRGPQSYQGHVVTLDDDVVITYKGRTVHADHIEYNRDTDELTATGHLLVTGGENGERIPVRTVP